MEMKRKLAMVVAAVAVALGAGHVMQNGLSVQKGRVASAEAVPTSTAPKQIVPLAAGLGSTSAPAATVIEPAVSAQVPTLPPAAFAPTPEPTETASAPEPVAPEAETTEKLADTGDACAASLDVIATDQAMLDLTLIAPCHQSERVVLRHGGLAVTGVTSSSGMLFVSLPGMDTAGEVMALFSDGLSLKATEALPDMGLYRRFAVQWMAEDAFALNAFENGAVYGGEGHIWAENPQRPLPNIPIKGGYLTRLGDSAAALPMLAEVYTYPMDLTAPVDLTVEASVTAATCDRELLGEVLLSEGGTVVKTDLTMATPTCDAIGDVLVLNNPLPDLKLAAAN